MSAACRRIRVLLILVLLPAIWSCAQIREWGTPNDGVAPAAAPAGAPSRPSAAAPAQTTVQAQTQMDAGRYQKALDLYDMAYRSTPQDRELLQDYTASVEKIRSAAQNAMDQQDFVRAGRNFNVLLKNYATLQRLGGALSFDAADLEDKLAICRKSIAKQGFEAYRNGSLDEAIALWEALLEIDPGNTEIKDALRIARMQHRNLQE